MNVKVNKKKIFVLFSFLFSTVFLNQKLYGAVLDDNSKIENNEDFYASINKAIDEAIRNKDKQKVYNLIQDLRYSGPDGIKQIKPSLINMIVYLFSREEILALTPEQFSRIDMSYFENIMPRLLERTDDLNPRFFRTMPHYSVRFVNYKSLNPDQLKAFAERQRDYVLEKIPVDDGGVKVKFEGF